MRINKHKGLSKKAIEALSIGQKLAGGGGLYFHKTNDKGGRFYFRFNLGKPQELGLGSFPSVSLEMAQKKAQEARQKIAQGINPLEEKRALKAQAIAEEASKITFIQFFNKWFADVKAPALTSEVLKGQWTYTINHYCEPLHQKPIIAITETDIVKVLKPIWQSKHPTAKKILNRLEQTFGAAIGQKIIKVNPAAYKNNIDAYLPHISHEVKHHAALNYNSISLFMQEIRKTETIEALALELLILTGLRLNEVLEMDAQEIDFASRLWTIPAARMKMRKAHLVPLTEKTYKLVTKIFEGACVPPDFITEDNLRGLLNRTLKALDLPHATLHGFRSTFTDWATDNTSFQDSIIQGVLAHVSDKTTRAYKRTDLIEKKRELLQLWERFIDQKEDAKVISLFAKA